MIFILSVHCSVQLDCNKLFDALKNGVKYHGWQLNTALDWATAQLQSPAQDGSTCIPDSFGLIFVQLETAVTRR